MRSVMIGLAGIVTAAGMGAAQQAPTGYDDTPVQPNGRWHIHDGKRPQPAVVTQGPLTPTPPPQDATC